MTVKVTKQSGKQLEWKRRLARFATSGQQVRQFCQAEAVSPATFYRWQNLLEPAAVALPATGGFIDAGPIQTAVRKRAKDDPVSAALEVRLELGHGLVLHIVRR